MAKVAVISFGRMAPVTVGHRRLVMKLRQLAKECNGDALLFLSKSYDGRDAKRARCSEARNPLKYADKLRYVRDAFGDLVSVEEENHPSLFPILSDLWLRGYTDLVLVGDQAFLDAPYDKYNGEDYEFDSITKYSSGYRAEDAQDFLSTVSATRVREAVVANDYDLFRKLVATKSETKNLWLTLRREMECDKQA